MSASAFDFIRNARAVAFLFPGQGSQSLGMGEALAAHYPAAAEAYAEADEVLGFPLSRLCFAGPEEVLTDTINAQPALLATSMAALRALHSELGEDFAGMARAAGPVYVAGHSMGEYSALVAAGALSYADGLRLVRERGRLMKQAGEASPGMMAAILGLDEERVAAICTEVRGDGRIVQVANDNCPGQVVISGDRAGMEAAMAALQSAGARKVAPLAVSIAAHSPLMQPAADALRYAIEATPVHAPQVPVIANTSAEILISPAEIRSELVAQLTGSVRWTASMQRALAAGVTDFVEIGAGEVLTGLMKRIERSAGRHSVADPAGTASFAGWLRAN
jgi:[acyl-carrier-protein] S-malonyltransferase